MGPARGGEGEDPGLGGCGSLSAAAVEEEDGVGVGVGGGRYDCFCAGQEEKGVVGAWGWAGRVWGGVAFGPAEGVGVEEPDAGVFVDGCVIAATAAAAAAAVNSEEGVVGAGGVGVARGRDEEGTGVGIF